VKYTVEWTPIAQNHLAEIWMSAPDRMSITRAAKALDALLQVDAHELGESRFGATRIVFASPLACYVDVIMDDRKVSVLAVWEQTGRKR
jgi:hypothetical protein